MVFTCEELEGLRSFSRLSQVAVRERVGFLPGAAGEWGQRQVLDKQLLEKTRAGHFESKRVAFDRVRTDSVANGALVAVSKSGPLLVDEREDFSAI